MPRYIDADTISMHFDVLAKHAQRGGLYTTACIYNLCLQVINDAKTVDVVPRSEFDALTKTNDRLMQEKAALECIIATARNQGKAEAKTEVAREIFAAIEFDIHQLMFERDETRAIAIEGVIANLKKEYTEGEG